MQLRPARPDDLPQLVRIELAAGRPFRALGMHAIADDAPPTIDHLAEFERAGRAWLLADVDDVAVAYLLLAELDGAAHIEQVSLLPELARQGLGRRLIDHAIAWARAAGHSAVTLTSFAEVPWNGPYYQRLGFRVVPDERLTPGLRALREQEAARGLDAWPRVVMRRAL